MKESAESLEEIIRRQRELSRLSMRQFAGMAGISNPYLSQIEPGTARAVRARRRRDRPPAGDER